MPADPTTPTERTTLIVLALAGGERLTTRQVAELCGISQHGAWALLCRISAVAPLALYGGEWYLHQISQNSTVKVTGRD